MIKTIILAVVVIGVIGFIRHYNEYDEPERNPMDEPMYDLDDILMDVFGDCMEAWCEDCGLVLATGTGPYKPQVNNVAYVHSEVYDHEVHVRSWVDE